MVIDQSLFYDLTQLPSEGVLFEGALIDDWKFDFSVHDASRLVCTNQADMTGRLLTGSLAFESRILHYLIVRILLPRSSNLAQVSEEDLIVMWACHKGLQIDWAHLVRYHMHKALRLNAPLPYPYLVTLFLQHFNIPLDSEPYVPIVATCPFAGEQRRGSRVRFPKEERCTESPPMFICGKRRENRRKPVQMKILSSGVVFTLEEGISTSHICLKGQQPIF